MLEAKNIYKTYDNAEKKLQVLKGIDLSVEKGQFIALVGPSGAGKSTFLHILGGLDIPSEGNVVFDGQDIYKLSDFKLCQIRNKKIGFVFQFYHLLPEFTVLENVLMPALISQKASLKSQWLNDRSRMLLEEAGLSQRSRHFPSQLSGGEQQRVAIVRALINEPQILFCDEPTGNLDSETGSGIISLIKKISQKNNMAIVMVTHNQELAKQAQKVYHLRDGILEN